MQTEGCWQAEGYCGSRIHYESGAGCEGYTVSLCSLSYRYAYGCLSYFGKIQDKDEDYYMQFNIIVCGLDSVEARRWINATLVNMVDDDNPESLKPLIDGGTEGKHIL